MDWQQPAALAIVFGTVAWWLWRRLRPRQFDFHRDTGCGCATTAQPPRVRVEGRRGERPRTVVLPG